ncbi:MAG: class I SAM-dependent methyltransferase [Bacteroidetes bacterium]|nr:class I SAM-dependent methyltransferase [Bacteroidota bacterium]
MQPQPFDAYAKNYDANFTYTSIGRMQRGFVIGWLARYLTSPKKILEINCGTGEDALQLALLGHSVIATDASEKMIEEARQKKFRNQISDIRFECANFNSLKEKFNSNKFDLIFSNFGGLNCADKVELKKLSADFAALLNENGKLFFVIMGSACKWEQLYFLLKGNIEKAFRRKSSAGIRTQISDVTFNTHYYSPSEMKTIFGENFDLEFKRAVGLFVPPSYLQQFFENKLWLLKILGLFDYAFTNFSFLANWGDHYVIVLNKK